MVVSASQIKQKASEQGISIYREKGKTVVEFPNNPRAYKYSEPLIDVAKRIGLISTEDLELTRNSHGGMNNKKVVYKYDNKSFNSLDEASTEFTKDYSQWLNGGSGYPELYWEKMTKKGLVRITEISAKL